VSDWLLWLALTLPPGSPPATGSDELFWSLQPVSKPQPPAVHATDWPKSPIDHFILGKLESLGMSPAPIAHRRTLIRRAYYDLLGLPPPPEKVEKFVHDAAPDAWATLIDELLKSPHYGERWGRHWLDVARYADSGGYETDIYFRNAWRYRDYVVKSFNDDKPYDRFVQEQIAGDELWPDNLDLDPKRVYIVSDEKRKHLEARIGTGLYTLGPVVHESGLDAGKLRYEQLTDWVDTTGSVFMGLTFGCARCHDHKFDPITQRDYFAMQAIFAGSVEVEVPLLTAMEVADWRQHYPRIIAVDEARAAYRLFEKRVAGRALTPEEEAEKRRHLENIAQAVLQLPERAASVPNSPFDALMGTPTVSVLGHERAELIRPVHLLDRGEPGRPRAALDPALPEVLARASDWTQPIAGSFGSRKQLALWLTGPQHPLTARVMVNRIWQWHFGRGIAATPNDFGSMGERPTHPELLDWLATEFVNRGWSVKEMHRLIMRSNVYQQASKIADCGLRIADLKSNNPQSTIHNPQLVDPDNRYLWQMNRLRLEAEALWDAVHAAAGTLNPALGGRPVVPPLAEDEIAALRDKWHWPVSADPRDHTRRGMYVLVRRNFRFPMFEVFDAPITSVSCPARDVTTVAPQALWSLNNRSVFRQAQEFAARVVHEAGERPEDWVDRAWLIALARPPSNDEKQEALKLMETLAASSEPQGSSTRLETPPPALSTLPPERAAALAKLCLALYNLSEFAFVD
jgi:hypothetical protein